MKININNIKEYLQEAIDSGIDFFELQYEILGDNLVKNWPLDDDDEPLDMENFEWLVINDDFIKVTSCGDWQEPLTMTIKLIDGVLTVTDSYIFYQEGMDEETFLKSINR
jgi:hypothetical protein